MRVIGGGDHFLWGLEEEIGEFISAFIKGFQK